MENLTTLVGQVAGALVPALPYLLKAGEMAGEEAAKKIGEDAWERAKKLWTQISDRLIAKPATREVITAIAAAPTEQDAQAALRFQLKQLFTEDQKLAAALMAEFHQNPPPAINIYQRSGGVDFNDRAEIHGPVTGRDSYSGTDKKS